MGTCCQKEYRQDNLSSMDLNTQYTISSFSQDKLMINSFSAQYIACSQENESILKKSYVKERLRRSIYFNSLDLSKIQEFATTILSSPIKSSPSPKKEKKPKNLKLTDSPEKRGRNSNGCNLLKKLSTFGSVQNESLKASITATTLNLSPKKRLYETVNLSPKKRTLKSLSKKTVIFLVYPSGTNKDDVVFSLFKDYGFEKLSIGSLLREYGVNHPEYGAEILSSVFKKKDVSSDIVVNLLLQRILFSESQRFIISGFPKNENNMLAWKQIVGSQIIMGALVMLTYTRKEYEFELNERAKKDGDKRITFKEAMQQFDYYITETNKVTDSLANGCCIRVSAKLDDHVILNQLIKHELITSII